MNKRISNFFEKHSACISILALALSIVSLLISLPRCRNLGFDYLGFIVAVLSIIAAFAIGFQIWSAISSAFPSALSLTVCYNHLF